MKIIQLTNRNEYQTMGYCLISRDGHVVMVDSGHKGNGTEVLRVLEKTGGQVEQWFITHPHQDHFLALMEALQAKPELSVGGIWFSTELTDDWEPQAKDHGELVTLNSFLRQTNIPVQRLCEGLHFDFGTMHLDVLTGCNPDIASGDFLFNDQSCVLRFEEDGFVFLMLGDLGSVGGRKLLKKVPNLRANAVQMAHHGQNGVEENVYQAIQPTFAFWPTPDWLWENSGYGGTGQPGTGPFKTLEVRGWMEKLHTQNITSFTHTMYFDTLTGETGEF